MKNEREKALFLAQLKDFANTLSDKIAVNDEWTIKGFIDIFKNIYTISSDTKIVSKILELHLFPQFLAFAEQTGYDIELATYQNYYPDLTFISKTDPSIKFAVDLKTTYREENHPDFCNGFTLGLTANTLSIAQVPKTFNIPMMITVDTSVSESFTPVQCWTKRMRRIHIPLMS